MKLRVRLIISFMVLILISSLFIGIFYYRYTEKQYEMETLYTANVWCQQILSNYIDAQKQMEQSALSLLSNPEVLTSIRALSMNMADDAGNQMDIVYDKNIVRRNINTAYNIDNFYRIIVFNKFGVIAFSNNKEKSSFDVEMDPMEIDWMSDVIGTEGEFVKIGKHMDDWGMHDEDPEPVFSVVKELNGNNLGYIEIQKSIDSLEESLSVLGNDFKIILTKGDGTPIFIPEKFQLNEYQSYLSLKEWSSKEKNQVTGKDELIVVRTVEEIDVKILMIGEWKKVNLYTNGLLQMTTVIIGSFFIFSSLFTAITANLLTSPIQKLRSKIENCDLSNIDQNVEIKSSDGDIQALTSSFNNLLERLGKSIQTEKKLAILQLQAQFDTLQAQVNPHFIYNVLNTISNRGFENDDDVICNICGNLAAMLRYSTNTKNRYATIKEEIDYLNNYLYLFQARYRERLYVNVQIDPKIENEIIPKISLQQLVENSFEHGGGDEHGITITIRGYCTDRGWRVEITDNGKGLRDEKKEALTMKMQKIKNHLLSLDAFEMEIGGMGVANTFGRMYLLYRDNVIFTIENRENTNGVVAIIGVEGWDNHV